MNLLDLKVGDEVFLSDLTPGIAVGLEAVRPPDPLYLPGIVGVVMERFIEVRMCSKRDGETAALVRLHADAKGRFVTDADRPVRVFRLEE